VKQRISWGVADYIVDYVISINQRHQVDVSAASRENNIHGAVFGIAA